MKSIEKQTINLNIDETIRINFELTNNYIMKLIFNIFLLIKYKLNSLNS